MPKGFTQEGAQHFKGDGKIYGGDPVLIKSVSMDQSTIKKEEALAVKKEKISKFSWADEEKKVKIYIDTA